MSLARKSSRYKGKRSLENYGIVQSTGRHLFGKRDYPGTHCNSQGSTIEVRDTLEVSIPRGLPEEDTTGDLSEPWEGNIEIIYTFAPDLRSFGGIRMRRCL